MSGAKRGRLGCYPTGYQMIRSFSIQNFRCFKEVSVDQCRRINIIVGENGSGKTALLEALFLAAGVSPELVLRTRAWRGVELERMSGPVEDIHRALWSDLFYRFQTNRMAVVSLKGTGEETRSVTVKLTPPGQMRVVPPSRRRSGEPPKVVPELKPIEFKWKIKGRTDSIKVSPYFKNEKLVFPPVPESIVKAVFFASNRIMPSVEMVNRFSLLSRTFRDEQFIQRFNQLYASITDLSVEVATGAPMLFAKVIELPEKIPLSLASGGMNKLAAILLSMPYQSGGIILVDEIENGFYYKRLPLVWKALLEFAREYDCQIFASSHSRECLDAAATLAKASPDEFCVIRTVQKDGEAKIRQFGGDKFIDAMDEDIEIR